MTGLADSVTVLRGRRPDLRLAADLARLAGADGRYGACDDATVIAAVGRWTALISTLEARRLEALRAVVRRNPAAGHQAGAAADGDLPGAWLEDAGIQVGLELARGPKSVSPMIELAVQLVRLPLTEQALRDGDVDYSRARLIAGLTANLTDDLAGLAEQQLMAGGWLAGKTWAQILRRLSRIVINLDPDAARKRRETAERFARVVFGTEGDGTARLGGYNLPADQALQADAQISARARAYRQAGLPGSMELLRAQAFLDILAGLDRRAGTSPAPHRSQPAHGGEAGEENREAGNHGAADGGEAGDGGTGEPDDGGGSGGGGPCDGDGDGTGGAGTGDGFAANVDLTIPLATLLGLADRAGKRTGSARSTPGWPAGWRCALPRTPGATSVS